jgi:hypothetical protein
VFAIRIHERGTPLAISSLVDRALTSAAVVLTSHDHQRGDAVGERRGSLSYRRSARWSRLALLRLALRGLDGALENGLASTPLAWLKEHQP